LPGALTATAGAGHPLVDLVMTADGQARAGQLPNAHRRAQRVSRRRHEDPDEPREQDNATALQVTAAVVLVLSVLAVAPPGGQSEKKTTLAERRT